MDKVLDRLLQHPRIRAFMQRLRLRRQDELGREQGQTVVRVTISLCVLAYLITSRHTSSVDVDSVDWLVFLFSFIVLSVAVMLLALRDTSSSTVRRVAMNVADVVAVSYLMVSTEKAGVPLFVLYLWVTLGNGFRFGVPAMVMSAALSLVGFSVVVALTPLWQELVAVSIAVAISLIVLPLYSVHLVRRRAMVQNRTEGTFGSTGGSGADHAMQTVQPSLRERVRALLQRIKLKRQGELGREQGQTVVRVVIVACLLAYLTASHYPINFDAGPPAWLVYVISYFGLSVVVMVLAFRDIATSTVRRTAINVGDITTISYLMVSTGEAGIPLFVLYLWVTLGNGFRFGLRPMLVSAALSLVGFSGVVIFSPVWEQLVTVSVAVTVALILLPLYSAHLIHQLGTAMKRAEEANAAKSRFLARMSHELRTPLNGILGATDLLAANKRFAREDHALLDVIRDSIKVSLRQIDNVLDFAKIEAGKLVIEQTEFDLHELLNRTIRLVRGIALEKNLRLMLRIEPVIPYRLVGDPHHIQEVLLNLLFNAIKFTDKGYVSLDANLVREDEQSALIRFAVHDTGIGMEPEALGRIFEAFSQEDTSTTRRYGGTGLGTTIAKELVDLMGGRLDVNSEKGVGSTFSAEISFARQAQQSDDRAQLAGMRVLLISERPVLRERVAARMQEWNVSLNVVSSVTEATGLLGRSIRLGNPIHAVLVDSGAVFVSNGTHRRDDFLEKAWLASTTAFLVCDISLGEAQLRKWGYAGLLPYDLPRETLFNALHASGLHHTDIGRGVVRVEPWAWGQATRRRARLLVADDNRTNLMILRKILETANYEVDTAEDGERALEMMLNGRYKAAIVDMHMPGLDGTAVIKQYRLLRAGPRIPIVMLTANVTVDAKIESADAGADAYLAKPATAAEILGTIERLLNETEVYDLTQNRPRTLEAQPVPILDTEIITELDRLYNDPTGVTQILDEFERESRRLLDELSAAVAKKNHAGFGDLLHALKGNGANVGALRLVQVCHELGACSLLDFRREGEHMLRRLEEELVETTKALREFTAVGGPGPAHGSDLS